MNRLQKKCLIASTGIHLLLGLIVVIGPGFMSSSSKKLDDLQPLNFVPSILVDAAVSGGGNPKAGQPAPTPITPPTPPPVAPTPPPPQPKTEPKPQPQEDPVPAKETKAEDSLEPATPKKHLPAINTKVVTRTSKTKPTISKANEDTRAEERAAAATRQRIAGQLARAADNIRAGTAGATQIGDLGPGGGGPTYAGYAAWVQTVYMNAWVPPEEASTDDALVYAVVTIGRDGTVLSKSIVIRCGNRDLDSSVQRTLDRVLTIGRPFPEGVKDSERTYKLRFDIKSKRGLA